MLTQGGYSGWPGYDNEAEAYPQDYLFVTHVFDVVKLGLTSTSASAFAKQPILVTV